MVPGIDVYTVRSDHFNLLKFIQSYYDNYINTIPEERERETARERVVLDVLLFKNSDADCNNSDDDNDDDEHIRMTSFPHQCVPLVRREIWETQECGSWPTSADGVLMS